VLNALQVSKLEDLVNANALFTQLQTLISTSPDTGVVIAALGVLTKPSFLKKNANLTNAIIPILLSALFNKDPSLRRETLKLIKKHKLHDIFSVLMNSDVKISNNSSLEEYSALLTAVAGGIATNIHSVLGLVQTMINDAQSKVTTYLLLNRALALAKSQSSYSHPQIGT